MRTVTLTETERAACHEAEDAFRTGLPVGTATRRHLAAVRRKLNRHRYGTADAFTPSTVAPHGGVAYYH
jgi:hypothetical protein